MEEGGHRTPPCLSCPTHPTGDLLSHQIRGSVSSRGSENENHMRWHTSTERLKIKRVTPMLARNVLGTLGQFWCNHSGKRHDSFLLNYATPLCGPSGPLLGIYPRDIKMYSHRMTCTRMLTAALAIIVKNWKHPRCLPIKNEPTVVCYVTRTTQHEEAVN